MTALDALVAVLDAGGKVVPDPERPKVLFPTDLRDLVAEHRPALRALVIAYGHCTADAFRRAQVFGQQIKTWGESGRFGFPVLVLPGAPAPKADQCISCGAAIADGWRCTICLEAVHIALTLATMAAE